MHDDELDIREDLVQRLMHDQFPDWADLPLSRVHSAGTDNAIFRLGDELSVRMPRISWSADDPAIEHRWLPRIAPRLPIPVPVPLGLGIPSAEYPWHWTVCTWLPGRTAYEEPLGDLDQAARDLAGFVKALHEIDASGGPPQEAPLAGRGGPLAKRDDAVGKALSELHGVVDLEAAAAAWRLALETPLWDGQPVWIHGDLQHSNFLVQEGCLSGIIDFGGLGVGDPAADLIPAWSFFGESSSPDLSRSAGDRRCNVGARPGLGIVRWVDRLAVLPRYEPGDHGVVARGRGGCAG